MYMNDEASCILSIAYVFNISRKSMATIVMDEKEFIIYTVVYFFQFGEGLKKWDRTCSNWNKATEFVRDYKSGHSSYGKRAIEVNINIPDNSNKMFEKQFDSFLTYIDVLFVFIADVGKI